MLQSIKLKSRIFFFLINKGINLKLYFGNWSLQILLVKTQSTKGISTKDINSDNLHFIFWDLDNCSLEDVIEILKEQQIKWNLSNIFIFTDKINSFRAVCFSKRTLREYIQILSANKYVDFQFIKWVTRREKGIIRTGTKKNRNKQKLVAILMGYEKAEIPKKIIEELYLTSLNGFPKKITNRCN